MGLNKDIGSNVGQMFFFLKQLFFFLVDSFFFSNSINLALFYQAAKILGIDLGAVLICWAEARVKIARMTLTIKLDGNWSSFQLANSAPPLSVTDSAIAPSARMH